MNNLNGNAFRRAIIGDEDINRITFHIGDFTNRNLNNLNNNNVIGNNFYLNIQGENIQWESILRRDEHNNIVYELKKIMNRERCINIVFQWKWFIYTINPKDNTKNNTKDNTEDNTENNTFNIIRISKWSGIIRNLYYGDFEIQHPQPLIIDENLNDKIPNNKISIGFCILTHEINITDVEELKSYIDDEFKRYEFIENNENNINILSLYPIYRNVRKDYILGEDVFVKNVIIQENINNNNIIDEGPSEIGGYRWRPILDKNNTNFSFYIDLNDINDYASLNYVIVISNPDDPNNCIIRGSETIQYYTDNINRKGMKNFITFDEITQYMSNDNKINIKIYVRLYSDPVMDLYSEINFRKLEWDIVNSNYRMIWRHYKLTNNILNKINDDEIINNNNNNNNDNNNNNNNSGSDHNSILDDDEINNNNDNNNDRT